MTPFLASLSSTTLFWMLYAAVALPMLIGLLHGRAPWSRLLLWPLSAAVGTALIGAALSVVSHALAPDMTVRQMHGLIAMSVLGVPGLGYALGRLAARTTRRAAGRDRTAPRPRRLREDRLGV